MYCSPLHFPSFWEMSVDSSSNNNCPVFINDADGLDYIYNPCRKFYAEEDSESCNVEYKYFAQDPENNQYVNSTLIDTTDENYYIYNYPFWFRDSVNQYKNKEGELSKYITPYILIETKENGD
jgi:hypothetical protein